MASVVFDGPTRGSRVGLARVTVVGVAVLLIGGLAAGLGFSQASSRKGVRARFAARTAVTADVIHSYVADLMTHEARVARSTLSGRHPRGAFAKETAAFGFEAALLLDDRGRALAVAPSAPTLLGTQLAARYAHLARAESGHPAVSAVVPSAARHRAVVAFAVPYQTPYGRRVFSGAYRTTQTPMSSFLGDALTTPDARLYVVDDAGHVVSSNQHNGRDGQLLQERDAVLSRAIVHGRAGFVDEGGTSFYFATHGIPGAPWSLVMAVPRSFLYAAVDGPSRWVPWLILAGLAVLVGFNAWLTTGLLTSRRRIADANVRLERLARTDPLTGLFNRRYITEHLSLLCAASRRHGFPVAVLMVDVDHFKQINDTFGHSAGDEALRHVADRLARSLRTEDLAARWGGEEFVLVLPHTGLDEAMHVAERLREDIARAPVSLGNGGDAVTLSVSIGVAEQPGDLPDTLVHRADLALYEAKRSGRNVVRAAQVRSVAP